MAKIEQPNDMQMFNVEARVGLHKPNHWSDVVVVQALLKYVREGQGGERGIDFLPGAPPLPFPDGVFKRGETDTLILAYQIFANQQQRTGLVSEDGVISRVKGGFTYGTGKRWTLDLLNSHANVVCFDRIGDPNHLMDVQRTFPIVTAAVNAFALPF